MNITLASLDAIGKKFRIPGKAYAFSVITNGNINQTYKVTYAGPDGMKSYVFQNINTFVFANPKEIMENIDRVTTHIRKRAPAGAPTLHFHHTADGQNFCYDENGSFWRVMNYIDSITFETTDDLSVIYATGEAFGQFQTYLSDFDGSLLHETIPEFHNTKKRLDTILSHAEENPLGRSEEAAEELAYIRSVYDDATRLSVEFAAGKIPVRVTHNDTKCNNVLFDRDSRRPLVVIDLDTVMPGMAMYDFGDAVRCICNTAAEDEPDIRRVYFDTSKFRSFAKGYLRALTGGLTQGEIDELVPAAFSITVELASRFLDDYLTGDAYFKVNYPGHNLVRARCQLKLAQDILRKQEELAWIIREV